MKTKSQHNPGTLQKGKQKELLHALIPNLVFPLFPKGFPIDELKSSGIR